MTTPHLLVHDRKDNVGVVVVEGLAAGTEMLCVVTHDNTDFRLVARQDVPIGHKVALRDLKVGDTVVKYGQDIRSMCTEKRFPVCRKANGYSKDNNNSFSAARNISTDWSWSV